MQVSASLDAGTGWVSVSDLAEYAYCPRALWYRHNPPAEGAAPQSVRSREEGTRFHRRILRARNRRERWAAAAWALLALGAALLATVVALGLLM